MFSGKNVILYKDTFNNVTTFPPLFSTSSVHLSLISTNSSNLNTWLHITMATY